MGYWASECPDVKNYKRRLNPVWHRMLYSCTHMATVGFKGLTVISNGVSTFALYMYNSLADRRAYATVLRPSSVCRRLSVTLCIVAKRCILEQ